MLVLKNPGFTVFTIYTIPISNSNTTYIEEVLPIIDPRCRIFRQVLFHIVILKRHLLYRLSSEFFKLGNIDNLDLSIEECLYTRDV